MMTTELMKQRIKWLVEHGGIAEDAMSDVRRELRIVKWGICAIVLAQIVADAALLL